MLAILNILRKTFVTEYYRLNTGFLFLVAMFAFGILRPEDHIALASYVFASPFLLVLMGLLFGLYHLKTVYFVRQRMLWNSHSFLFQLLLIPKPQRWVSWLYVQWMLWLPVALYVIFVSYYGWWTGEKGSVIATILYLFCVPLVGVAAYEYRLHRPNPDTRFCATKVNISTMLFLDRMFDRMFRFTCTPSASPPNPNKSLPGPRPPTSSSEALPRKWSAATVIRGAHP